MRRVPLLLLLAALIMPCLPAAAQDWDRYHFRATPLADHLVLLQGAGGNVLACISDQGVLLVDSDYEQMSAKILAAVDSLATGPARCVVNTHWHFDHVGGNAALAGTGAVIVAHATVFEHMGSPQHLDVLDEDVPASPAAALPSILVREELSLQWGGTEIHLRHAPHAHTDGDLIVHFPQANVFHAGDLFFNTGYPYIDTAHGGHIDGIIAGIEDLLGRCDADTRIVPGHGPLGTPGELRTYLQMLRDFRGAVVPLIEQGKSLEEIVEAHPTRELDEVYGKRMFPREAFTQMIWLSMQGDGR